MKTSQTGAFHHVGLPRVLGILLGLLTACAMGSGPFAGAALCCQAAELLPDVHEIEANPDAYLDKEILFQGRFQSLLANDLKLVDSEIVLKVPSRPRNLPGRGGVLDIKGVLKRNGGKLEVEVERVSSGEPTVQLVKARKEELSLLLATNPQAAFDGLQKLIEQTTNLGNWYEDKRLTRLAKDLSEDAFTWECEAALKEENVAKLHELAERAMTADQKPLSNELRFEAYQLAWQTLPDADSEAHKALAQQILIHLPGSENGLGVVTEAEIKRFIASPKAAFDAAPEENRVRVHRLFFLALWYQAITQDVTQKDGVDDTTLEQAKAHLPELTEFVKDLRRRQLFAQAEKLAGLAEGKVIMLASSLREVGAEDKAKEVLHSWLGQRRRSLDASDTEGRITLADDYVRLLSDNLTAAELLLEVESIAPGLEPTSQALGRLGYRKVGDDWRKSDTLTRGELDQIEKQDSGAVEPGMTEAEVLKRSRRPDRIVRTISLTKITETWIYDGQVPYIIVFSKSTLGGQATVVAVKSL